MDACSWIVRERANTTSTPRIQNTRNFHTIFALWKRDPKSDKIARLEATDQGNIKCKEGERRPYESGACKSDLPLVAAFPIRLLQPIDKKIMPTYR